jgi:hypothetical protein
MAAYRIYWIDRRGHVCAPAIIIECETDQQAIERARKDEGALAVELWNGAELIHRFEPRE